MRGWRAVLQGARAAGSRRISAVGSVRSDLRFPARAVAPAASFHGWVGSARRSAAVRVAAVPSNCQSSIRRGLSTDVPEHVVVSFPALSPTMTQGTIVSWSVEIGDEVTAGDQLGEIETDKATMSFDSTEDGYVAKLLVDAGTSDIQLGTPVMVICEEEGDVGAFANFVPDAAAAPAESPEPEPTPAPATPAQAPAAAAPAVSSPATAATGDRVFASPLAKVMAAEASIPLSAMTGTGGNGRITKADVLAFKAAMEAAPAPAPAQTATASAPAAGVYTDIDVSNIRKTIATRLMESKQTIPHYYLTVDIRMDAINAIRKQLNEIADGAYKLSVNDFIIKASALSMKHVPEVNSSWQGDFIRQYSTVDICVAVSTENGLITPIVTDAHSKGLSDISADVRDLATRARDGGLMPEEYQGGTFTISNLGMFGINNFSAIVNPPQACILAVGATERVVVPDPASEETGLGVADMLTVTLSCDHRVVDGAVGAQWLKHFKSYLENPMSMML